MKKILPSIIVGTALFFANHASAQVGGYLCYNAATKALTVSITCPRGTTQINGTNISTLEAKGVNYAKCYTQVGQTSGSPSTGQLSLALRCTNAKDVMVNDTFEPSSTTRAEPALGSKTILFSGKFPNGMQITSQAIPNTFYSLKASIVCCSQ